MLKAIINFLNLKLELLNYFEQQHCLCELKSDNEGKVAPVEYVGNANYTVISHDAFDGVSYWRLRDKPTQDVLETKYQAGKRVEVKIPLRLVFSVRRTKLTTDDAYAFDRIRQTIVSQFNFDDGILKTTLGAEKVTVSVPTSNGNAKEVWDEETSETGTFEPTYAMVYGSIDIEVAVIYKGSCLPTECDDIDSNILHAFDFCKSSVVSQLTPDQVACLEAELCEPLCEQLAAILPEDVVADVFDCLSEAAQTELLDSECVIQPCADVTQQVNGTTIGTTASGGTNNQLIVNTAGTPQGTAANPSVIADTTLRNSAAPTWTDSVVAGVTKTLAQGKALDSDGATTLLADYIPTTDGFMFTCTPAAPAPSLSVAISDDTPNYGDSVTVTPTPTSLTAPITYTMSAKNSLGYYVDTVVVDGTFTYDCPFAGTFDIKVSAVDSLGNRAENVASITVGTIYAKHGITAAWEGKDSVLVGGQVDSITDATGNNNTATAPSSVTRLIKHSQIDPQVAGVSTNASNSTRRLASSVSQLVSTITYFAVIDFNADGNSGAFSVQAILGGSATPSSNLGGRYDFGIDVSTNKVFGGIRNSGGGGLATLILSTNALVNGKNTVVMSYDGATLTLILNGVTQTSAYASGSGLWTPATCNIILANTNVASYTGGCSKPIWVAGVKTSNVSDPAQLYADLVLKYTI